MSASERSCCRVKALSKRQHQDPPAYTGCRTLAALLALLLCLACSSKMCCVSGLSRPIFTPSVRLV
jgi:hypothetical protein